MNDKDRHCHSQNPEAKQNMREADRQRQADSRATESLEAKQNRRETDRHNQVSSRKLENDEAKEIRRQKNRERMAQRRAEVKAKNREVRQAADLTKNQYLKEEGWKTNPLHEQPWVQSEMAAFHEFQRRLQHRQCMVCLETWPVQVGEKQALDCEHVCMRCRRDSKTPKLFSGDNDMHPGYVPEELKGKNAFEM